MKKIGLGRGLGSLIPKKEISQSAEEKTKYNNEDQETNIKEDNIKGRILYIDINKIDANPYQPRESFEEKDLADLSSSIKEHGILQPLIVNKEDGGRRYELIAGERRLRAAKLAGLSEVPAIIKEADDFHKLQLAIIENIQRADLNPMEEARSFEKLVKEFKMTHNDIAEKVGKSRSFVSNTLRLLNLSSDIKEAIAQGKISAGQSRALVSLPEEDQKKIFDQIIDKKLTTRDVEEEAKKVAVKKHIRVIKKDPILTAKQEALERALGTKVLIKKKKEGGQILIEFYSPEEFNSIIEKIID